MLANEFSQLAGQAVEAVRRGVCDAAAGQKVDPAKLLEHARNAGFGAAHLAKLAEVAAERYRASQTLGARDWEAELVNAKDERTVASTALAAAQAKAEAANAELRAAHERMTRASNAVNRIGREREEMTRQVGDALAATGDRSDWTQFELGA